MSVEAPPQLLDDEIVQLMKEIRHLHREHIELIDNTRAGLSRLRIEEELRSGLKGLYETLRNTEGSRIREGALLQGIKYIGITILVTILSYIAGFLLVYFSPKFTGDYAWPEKAFQEGQPLWLLACFGWMGIFAVCGLVAIYLIRKSTQHRSTDFEEGYALLLKSTKPCIEVHFQVKSEGENPVQGFRIESSNSAAWQKSNWPLLGTPRDSNLGVSLTFYDGDAAVAHYPLSDERRALKDSWFGRQFGADLFAAYNERLIANLPIVFRYFRDQQAALLEVARGLAKSARIELKIKERQQTLSSLQRREALWNRLILPHNVKSEIYSKVRLFERGELLIRGILLYGPPGTGKTLVARTIADTINARFMPVSLSDLKRGSAGTTAQAVRDLFSHARDAHQAVIFVDECDAVFTTRDSLASEKSLDELVSSFLALWDGIDKSQAILVIGATNRRERIDPAIQSRFSVIQEIPLPDERSRAAILKVEAKKLGIDAEVASQFSRNADGFSGRDIENLVLTVASEVKTGKSVEQAFREGLGTYRQRGSDKIADTELLDELVLPTTVQEEIRILIEYISNPDKLKAKGFAIPKAALLYGPSGTGKSTIVRSIIKSTGLPFIAPTTSELRGTAEGQTGKIIRELFQRARSTAPCVLCLEDLDATAPRRGGSVTPGNLSAEAVGQLIQELEAAATGDARIFVLAVTDRPQDVDEAVLSRFPKRTQIAAPDLGSRAALFRKFIGERACSIEPERLIAKLAAVTEGKTARDIRNIVQDAEHRALARSLGANGGGELALDLEDFLRAVHDASLTSGAAQ